MALALTLTAGSLVTSRAAWAKPKVALTPIEGDATGDVRDAVVEALDGGELSLIAGREVIRAVDKLGEVSDLTEKDFRKLANELEADAVLAGKLDRAGGAKALKFRVFVHKKMAKGFTVTFKDPRSEKFRAALHDKVVDKIGATAAEPPDRVERGERATRVAEDDDAARRDKKKRPRADDEDDRAARKPRLSDDEDRRKPAERAEPADDDARSRKSADDEDRPRRAERDEDAPPRRAKKKVAAADEDIETGVTVHLEPTRTANRAAVRVDVGLSVLQRSFTFNSNPGSDAPNNTSLSPVPGVRFEAELYPLAFGNPNSAAAGIGFAAEYDKTLSLNLTTQNSMSTFTLPVKQSHYSIGLRYRLAFGRNEMSPTLTLGAGYGRRLFSPDRSSITDAALLHTTQRDTPQTNYAILDPGVTFRLPVTRTVALSAGGRGLIVTDTGSIQNGDSYGRAKVYGIEGMAALDVMLGRRFALRFSGEVAQIGFAFDGVGTLSNNVDGNPMTADVGGLSDRSIGGAATLAVIY